jgi:hypothetical protein
MKMLTTTEAAARLGISKRSVSRLCRAGKLDARRATPEEVAALLASGRIATIPHGGIILIGETEVERAQGRPGRGRPKKTRKQDMINIDEEIRLLEAEIAGAEARMAPHEEEYGWEQGELDEMEYARIAALKEELSLWRTGDAQAAIAAYVNHRVTIGSPESFRGKEVDLRSGKARWE